MPEHKGSKWTYPIPAWVSRKDADGLIARFTVPLWLFMVLGVLILLNALVWASIGLYEAGSLVVGAL